jgi:hypothetical protein
MKPKLVAIETRRYSEFFRRLLEHYAEGSFAKIDGVEHPSPDFATLIENWCTNAKILATRDFVLSRDRQELFGFHDHPEALWAVESELPFIEQLAAEKIIRFKLDGCL